MASARLRCCVLLLPLALLAARAAAQQVFTDGFEPPDLCAWSAVAAPCEDGEDLAADLVGTTLPYCLPRETVTFTGGSYTVCPTSTCQDGVTEGCAVWIEITGALFELATPRLLVDLAAVDADIPVDVTTDSFGSSSCTLEVRNGTADGSVDYLTTACHPGFRTISGTSAATVTVIAVDLAVTGGGFVCSAADSGLDEEAAIDDIEAAATDSLLASGTDLTGGRLFCLPPG